MILLRSSLLTSALLLLAACAGTEESEENLASAAALRRAIDLGEYHRVRAELPGLAASDSDGALEVVEYGLERVYLAPDDEGRELADERELLAALDIPGPLQTRVAYARGLAAFKADDAVAARAHLDTVVATTDSTDRERGVAHFLLALLRPDAAGLPDRWHWGQFRALEASAAGALDAGQVAQVAAALDEPAEGTLAVRR